MKLLSVIVPVYNVESYINRCIDSILSQSFTDFELILVDDGSTDSSGRICDEYSFKDERINVIHKLNGGQSSARNDGINIARGKYLSFIDADDYVAPAMLETLYELIIKYDADISECGYISVFKNEEVICEFGEGIEFGEGSFLLEKFLNADIFYGVVTKLFKTSLFDNRRFPPGRIFEDTWMTMALCLEELRYVRTDKPFYYYYQSENSTLRSEITPRKAREYIYILENQLNLVEYKVTDNILKSRLQKVIMEKSVFWYLGLALSDQKILRRIYAKLYIRRMNYSILDCLRSINIPKKNKFSFILCKAGLQGPLSFIKSLIS